MGIEQRPYVGTWQLNQKKLVQHTPDGFVFLNGDTALPGCPSCGGRINVQEYITQISVDSGTDSAATSANFSLAIPMHSVDSFHNNAKFLIKPTLEVHIYMRGYFPVKGQFAGISPEETGGIDITGMLSYPYYHVFHGVVTNVSHSYSGGFLDVTVNCASMLHFWQYQNMSSNASYFGARPTNSKLKSTLTGHNFNGMTPFSIIYTLFHDTAGAAGGVAFALDDKTNVDGKSEVLDRSIFSVALEYWRERFKTRMINLRMHGATGRVFSTAQAAFLSRLKTSQVNSILSKQWRAKASSSKSFDIFSAAETLNLISEVRDPVTGEKEIQGLDVIEVDVAADPSSASKESSVPQVNVAEMQAFVQDLGGFQANLFESTYETKLEVANKIVEVTGWEFYQDVDGDFVFKPPMYNLDTRSNRVYRIEDIDLISLNQTSKEPDVTYVTVTGSQFSNLKGTGLENEWGVRGAYIDYRLVAQYGWRPSSFETAYFNDPRSMFFAAVNRMDVLNIGVFSANTSIPLRPEIRPGYPVYIEHVDCFYYIQSLNHSLLFGGQCNTSLTLVGRRAAFYPPGDPNKSGVQAVDLGAITLPPRPLEIVGDDGRPRLVGFPNVVMALDPNGINPLFSLAGVDLINLDRPETVESLLEIAEQFNILSSDGSGGYVMHIDNFEDQRVSLGQEDSSPERYKSPYDGVPRSFTYEDLSRGAKKVAELSSSPNATIQKNVELIAQKRQDLSFLDQQIRDTDSTNETLSGGEGSDTSAMQSRAQEIKDEIARLEAEISSTESAINSELANNPDTILITTILELVGDAYLKGDEDYPEPSKSAQLLDLLSEKKAAFTNGQVPGFYRYYSSSHPDPKHQGQASIGSGGDGVLESPLQEVGFMESPTKSEEIGYTPEATLGNISVYRGIRILRSNGEAVVPTRKIQTLTFAKHVAEVDTSPTSFAYDAHYTGLSENVLQRIENEVASVRDSILFDGADLQETYNPLWEKYSAFGENPLDFWDEVTYPTDEISIQALEFQVSFSIYATISEYFTKEWVRVAAIPANEAQREQREKKAFFESLRVLEVSPPKLAKKTKSKTRKTEAFYSPVFPVSDAGGYEVVGTYRYGRGLLIDSGSTFDQVIDSDPLQFADPQAVEDFIDVLQGETPSNLGNVNSSGERTGAERRTTDVREAAVQELIKSIQANPAAPSEVVEQLPDVSSYTDVQLSNWIARSTEGVERVPVANAAFALADLQVHVNQRVCSCKAAQAGILMEALNTDNFVKVSAPDVDSVTQYVKAASERKVDAWRARRDEITGATGKFDFNPGDYDPVVTTRPEPPSVNQALDQIRDRNLNPFRTLESEVEILREIAEQEDPLSRDS